MNLSEIRGCCKNSVRVAGYTTVIPSEQGGITMLVTMAEILRHANTYKYAVPAPNVFSELDGRACIEGAEELCSPLILSVTSSAVPDLVGLGNILTQLAQKTTVPVAIQLERSLHSKEVMQAIRGGFTSVMIDCSKLSDTAGIERIRAISKTVAPLGISVEAELRGKCQDPSYSSFDGLSDPADAKDFLNETGIDAMAVVIRKRSGLDFDRLVQIKKLTQAPLVLRNSSGIEEEQISMACRMGINKVNVCIDILHAVSAAVQSTDLSGDHAYDLWEIIRSTVREEIKHQIRMTGSEGKAWLTIPKGLFVLSTSPEESEA